MPLSERLDPRSAALVVVDVQNDFCHPEALCAKAGCDISACPEMIENVRELIDAARQAGVFIVYIQSNYDAPALSPTLAEWQIARRGHIGLCMEGDFGMEFSDGISPKEDAPNEVIVNKHRFSAFQGTQLDLILRSNGIKTLVMSGIATDGCVESTLRDGFTRDYNIVSAKEAAATYSVESHEASQAVVEAQFGPLLPVSKIIEIWRKSEGNVRNWQLAVKTADVLRTLREQVTPEHTTVILVDMQNDFCDQNGVFFRRGGGINSLTEALPKMEAFLAEARKSGSLIVHVHAQYGLKYRHVGGPHGYRGPGPDGICSILAGGEFDQYDPAFDDLGEEPCLAGTWGEKPMPGFEPLPGEIVVRKHRYSAFLDTRLETVLRANDIRTVVLLGVTSNCSVESTARDAAGRDFYVVVASDCVAADSHADLHQGALKSLAAYFGQVVSSNEIIDAWKDSSSISLRANI